MDDNFYESKKEAAYRAYSSRPVIHNPFFNDDIVLGPEGFRHLWASAQGERAREEQIRRFTLLPLALHVLKNATTLQTYRKRVVVATPDGKDAPVKRKVQWWGFMALFVKQRIKVHVVVRKVGDGNLHFRSVMLHKKHAKR